MSESFTPDNADKLSANLQRIEELNRRLLNALAHKKPVKPELQGPGHDFFAKSAMALMSDAITNPARLIEQQVGYWGESLKNLSHIYESSEDAEEGSQHPKRDSRFKSEHWESNPYFRFYKDQYLTNADAVRRYVAELTGVDEKERRRLAFFSRQLVELMSPSNFLATNPEALERAIATEGESLVRGLENLVNDLERNDGELQVTLADPDAFTVGENLATTEGSVVFRNELIELIQYQPRTEKAHRIPFLILPPWINKFYILDLRPENSFIRWVVEQGFTVFVVSWVNPGVENRNIGMETYASTGCLTAIRKVQEITGEAQINAAGYCIGGTLLALVLAYLSKTNDRSVRSATFLTTLTEFTDLGELELFVSDSFLAGIKAEVQEKGYLPSLFMSRTFSFMRASDLVYGPAVRAYIMGDRPPAFDLLYWNGDSTNLPARMTVEYLCRLCRGNEFANEGFELLGETVKLKDVRQPLTAITCETDHIALWTSSYTGITRMGSRDKTFILSQSGHIAGIVNPPAKNRYGHYVNTELPKSSVEWREGAEFKSGSWWTRWRQWLARRSGAKIAARRPGDNGAEILCPAPGTYVLAKNQEVRAV